MILEFTVNEENDGKTVKHILKRKLELSSRLIKKLKLESMILCNEVPVRVTHIVYPGDRIKAVIDFNEESSDIIPENLPFKILYEDEYLIAVDKGPDTVVHPTFSHQHGTLANALSYYLSGKNINRKIRPVNRLDRDTTGVIIFALNQFVQEAFIRQMKAGIFKKEYLGIVHGVLHKSAGTINLPIARKPESIMLRHISEDGYPSVTHYEVLECFEDFTLLKFHLETGRTHQIRVHCQAIGHPLAGDTLYPEINIKKVPLLERQALHSHKTSFIHPFTKENLEIVSPLPEDMAMLIEVLRKVPKQI